VLTQQVFYRLNDHPLSSNQQHHSNERKTEMDNLLAIKIIKIIIIISVRLAPIQCTALLAANNLQSRLSSASSVASSMLRL